MPRSSAQILENAIPRFGDVSLGLQGRLVAALARQPGMRVIAASRKTRLQLQDVSLHADLLYRLRTVEIVLPPLHARGDDFGRLAAHFVRLFATRHGRGTMTLSETAKTWIAAALPGIGAETLKCQRGTDRARLHRGCAFIYSPPHDIS